MSKSAKAWIISLSVVTAIVAVIVILALRADRIVENIANQKLQELVVKKNLPLTYSDIKVNVLQGNIKIDDIQFYLSEKDSLTGDSILLDMSVKRLSLGHINWKKILKEQLLKIDAIRIESPAFRAYNVDKALRVLTKPNNDLAEQDSVRTADSNKKHAEIPLKKVIVEEVSLEDGQLSMARSKDKFFTSVEDVFCSLLDIEYNFSDSLLTYSDSLYLISAKNFALTTADGLFKMKLKELSTENSGAVVINQLSGGNAVAKQKLADAKGKVPVTWAWFDISHLETSPLSVIKIAKEKKIEIDSVRLNMKSVNLFRDNHYQPKAPYPMPQEGLLKLKLPLLVKNIDMSLEKMMVELTLTGQSTGGLQMSGITAKINNVTNKAGETIKAKLKSAIEDSGKADIDFTMTLNKKCEFSMKANVKNAQGEAFSDFLKPLFGVEMQCNISNIDMAYKADRHKAVGTYCMIYDNLKINVLKQETSIPQLAKYSGIINAFAPAILLVKNPRKSGGQPQAYNIEWERNDMKSFSVYMLGPMIDGMLESVLPPSIVKMIKKKRAEKKSN